jgi:lysyl-tRNA synthetase class 2
VTGIPHPNKNNDPTLRATSLPIILSPSLATLPYVEIENPETRIRKRHLDLLVSRRAADTFRVRSVIIKYIRDFLHDDNFMEVQTPIIADQAGGAIARPFTTSATEFSEKQLALRIAPEIWLKRLIIGGMDRVFEIGPAFRNEGLDATHNPEFTTCEFYKSYADLDELIRMTEQLVSGLAEKVRTFRKKDLGKAPHPALPNPSSDLSTIPFLQIEFIPAIEAALGEPLPNLAAEDVEERILAIFAARNIEPPSSTTLPRLLDHLASIYIEPQCTNPTFITHHPACMSPLAKSFVDPVTGQILSARAELFIDRKEIANMYEEENSPFEQRLKFEQQAKYRDDENRVMIDESYLDAMEYGLPPTGGWGAGVDRLCMLLTGSKRISDVLAFGSLRNVVNLSQEGPQITAEEKKAGKRGKKSPLEKKKAEAKALLAEIEAKEHELQKAKEKEEYTSIPGRGHLEDVPIRRSELPSIWETAKERFPETKDK